MFYENRLSTTAVYSGWREPVRSRDELLADYEVAGRALYDGTQGLNVRQWSCRAVSREDGASIVWDVQLSSGSGWVTMFTRGAQVTEVAFAFDVNMYPFIAFSEDNGDVGFWWFDSSDSTQKFTQLPTGSKNPRCCIDEKREDQTDVTDVIFAYIRGGSLYFRMLRERYQTEHLLKSGLGADAELVCVQMNDKLRLQFQFRGQVNGDEFTALATPRLSDIVSDLLSRSGVSKPDVDVTMLSQTEVLGYKCASQAGADTYIQPLRQAFFFDVSEYDKKIRFPMRGGPAVAQVSIDNMLDDHGDSPLHMERVQEAELLRKVSVISIDPAAGYAPMTQSAERRSNTVMATSESTTEVPITMSSDEAATVASKRIKVAWGELHKADFRLGVPWSSLTPADVIEVTDKRGSRYRMRVVSVSEDTGQIEIEAIEDADFAYRSSASGITPAPPRSTTPGLVGDTTPIPMNLPALRTSDNVPGIYVATVGGGTGWTGAEFWLSADDGQTYSPIGGVDIGSTVGTLDAAITAATDPFSVTLDQGELFNATPEQLAARQNAFAILTAGVAEIGQFANATEGAPLQYELDTISRGLLDTTAAPHDAGDRFVLLDDSVVFLPIDQSFSGRDLLIKAVSFGQTTDEATAVSFRYEPIIRPSQFYRRDDMEAVGGETTITLDKQPTGLQILRDGVLLTSGYTMSGLVATLATPATTGQEYTVIYWASEEPAATTLT